MRESNTRLCLSHINLSNWSAFLSPLSSYNPFTSFYLVFFSCNPCLPFSHLSSKHCKHISLSFCSSFVELVCRLVYATLLITSLLHLHLTRLSLIFQYLFFLKSWKPIYFTVFSSIVCIHLGYLRTDISGIDQASLFHLMLISLSLTLILFKTNFIYLTCVCPGISIH